MTSLIQTIYNLILAPELKAIVAMTERLKKQHAQLEQVTAEKEDALARLQVGTYHT